MTNEAPGQQGQENANSVCMHYGWHVDRWTLGMPRDDGLGLNE